MSSKVVLSVRILTAVSEIPRDEQLGVVSDETLREVSLYDNGLIITRPLDSSRGFLRLFFGDVVKDVIKYTSCPVIVVKKQLN